MKVLLALTVLFNVTGLASVTERVTIWSEHFRPAVELFQALRDVVFAPLWFLLGVSPPGWIADIILVWLGFFLAWNLVCFSIHGRSLRSTLRHYGIGFLRSYLETFFLLMAGPFAPLLMHRTVKWRLEHRKRRPTGVDQAAEESFPGAVGMLVFESLAYLGLLIGLFIVLVMANSSWT